MPFALHAPSILHLLVAKRLFLANLDNRRSARPVRWSLLVGSCMCFASSSVDTVLQLWFRYLHSCGNRYVICIATSTTHRMVSLHKHSCCIASHAQLGSPCRASTLRLQHASSCGPYGGRLEGFNACTFSAAKATRLVRHAAYFWCGGSASKFAITVAVLGKSVAVSHAHASPTAPRAMHMLEYVAAVVCHGCVMLISYDWLGRMSYGEGMTDRIDMISNEV